MIEYRAAITKEEISLAFALREQVFVTEQGVPKELEIDMLDDIATHVIAINGAEILACGRVVALDNFMKIGRLVVKKEFRGKGIGKELMSHLIKLATNTEKTIKLDAQLQAINFFKKLGFIAESDIFLDAGIEHVTMVYYV